MIFLYICPIKINKSNFLKKLGNDASSPIYLFCSYTVGNLNVFNAFVTVLEKLLTIVSIESPITVRNGVKNNNTKHTATAATINQPYFSKNPSMGIFSFLGFEMTYTNHQIFLKSHFLNPYTILIGQI